MPDTDVPPIELFANATLIHAERCITMNANQGGFIASLLNWFAKLYRKEMILKGERIAEVGKFFLKEKWKKDFFGRTNHFALSDGNNGGGIILAMEVQLPFI